jgi:hypothetical protein
MPPSGVVATAGSGSRRRVGGASALARSAAVRGIARVRTALRPGIEIQHPWPAARLARTPEDSPGVHLPGDDAGGFHQGPPGRDLDGVELAEQGWIAQRQG